MSVDVGAVVRARGADVDVRPAQIPDAWALGPHLRLADRQELEAAGRGRGPVEAIVAGIALGHVWAVRSNKLGPAPCAAFGLTDLPDGRGAPWLVSTEVFALEHARRCLRVAREVVSGWAEERDLANLVWVGNELHHRWIEACGFVLDKNTTYRNERTGKDFYLFYLCATQRSS